MSSAGRRIGRFRVERVLGAGGFATVLQAVDELLDDRVAIKILAENHSLDADVRERFLAEGRLLRRIDSPDVVRVLDLGETDRLQPYLVLQLAERGTLAARVAELRSEGWRPGPDDVRALVAPLTRAVAAVHRADVVHRDLSPGNVLLRSTLAPDPTLPATRLVGPDERLMLADLGLGKDLARSSGLTVAGGTEGFRPPEQRGTAGQIDGRSDLWSLSALVTWLVAGQHPTDETHGRALLEGTSLPGQVIDPLVQSLAAAPRDRHDTIAAWERDVLGALLAAAPLATWPPPGSRPTGTVVPEAADSSVDRDRPAGAARRRIAWLMALLFVVGGLIGGAVVAWDPGAVRQQVTVADDGQVTVRAETGEVSVVLVGPSTVEAGETARFDVEVVGATGWVWIAPDGRPYADVPQMDVAARSAGVARVTVIATSPDGEEVRAEHTLRVSER